MSAPETTATDAEAPQATWEPRLIPADKLLAPFSREERCGADLLYTDRYKQLKDVTTSDDPAVLGGDDFKPKDGWRVADWRKAQATAVKCLEEESKDLRVAGYLAQALARREGLDGMREGLWLMVELMDRYWDDLRPIPDRMKNPKGTGTVLDPGQRASEVEAVYGTYASILDAWPPCADEADEASVDGMLAGIAGLELERDRLESLLGERFLGQIPSDRRLRSVLSTLGGSYRDRKDAIEQERARDAAGAEERRLRAEEEARREAEEVSLRAAEEKEREAELAKLGIGMAATAGDAGEPSDRGAALRRIAQLASWMHRQQPEDPLALRLFFSAVWGGRSTGDATEPVPASLRRALAALFGARDWTKLASASMAALSLPWGRNWLDPAYYLARSLEARGAGAEDALAALCAELVRRLDREPDWAAGTFADGEPMASEEARAWADAVMVAAGRGRTSDATETGIPPKDLEKADALGAKGRMEEAVDLLQVLIEGSRSPREAFLRRLDFAAFCERHGLDFLAEPAYRSLLGVVEQRGLESWESSRLVARIYEGLYHRARAGSGDFQGLAAGAREKLCLLDPRRALSQEGRGPSTPADNLTEE